MKKRLVICCDGTWHDLSDDPPSNVVKLMQSIPHFCEDGVAQLVYYNAGLGSESSGWTHYTQGAFGWGIDHCILQAYRFLCLNYAVGDEIYLFGYSRGAYTVRSLVGLLNFCGLLRRQAMHLTEQAYRMYRQPQLNAEQEELSAFRQQWSQEVTIEFLGCWDTVGTLGIPDIAPIMPNQLEYHFHNTDISHIVRYARHAIAIDEIRHPFRVCHMTHDNQHEWPVDLKEMWFPGDHMAVGGGFAATQGLADISLDWMMQECELNGLGLHIERERIVSGIKPNPLLDFDNAPNGVFWLLPTHLRTIECDLESLHSSVLERWEAREDYRPINLMPLLEQTGSEVA